MHVSFTMTRTTLLFALFFTQQSSGLVYVRVQVDLEVCSVIIMHTFAYCMVQYKSKKVPTPFT